MKVLKDSRGFSAVELIVLLVALVGLAGVGYAYMKMKQNAAPVVSSIGPASSSQTSTVPPTPQVNSNKDLDTALSTLNQTNLDDGNSDGTQLGTQSGAF